MKLFGHPLHIMLIHFPSALLPMDLFCYAVYFYTGQTSFASASFYALAGGVILGWAAVLFGALDLIKIPADKLQALKKALWHAGINISVIIIYTVLAWIGYKNYPAMSKATVPLLAIKTVLIGVMMIGNYLGGSLILKDKIGVEE